MRGHRIGLQPARKRLYGRRAPGPRAGRKWIGNVAASGCPGLRALDRPCATDGCLRGGVDPTGRAMSLGYLRVLTAGESHGPQLTIFVQNLPAGLPVLAADIDVDLARRQKGYGRGGWQPIEHDCVEIVAGVRHGVTMGGPIAMVVKNKDWANWQGKMDVEPVADPPAPVTRLRPGHADLAGVVKYGLTDVRNVLERASARETASRVAAGGLGKVFLRQFGIHIRSHVHSVGPWRANPPAELGLLADGADHPWWSQVEESPMRTGDKE